MISMTLPQLHRHQCSIDGRVVQLRQTLAEMLAILLVAGPDKFISSSDLIEATWPDPDFAETILWRRIHELRQAGVHIENRYYYGYRIPRWAREHSQIAEAA